jgi:lactoylglutathione lyase
MAKPGTGSLRDEDIRGLAHFAIALDSREEVDILTQHLQSEGIIVAGKPRITGDGCYESVIHDPEGNIIELVSK